MTAVEKTLATGNSDVFMPHVSRTSTARGGGPCDRGAAGGQTVHPSAHAQAFDPA
jgi:hypothetical protein